MSQLFKALAIITFVTGITWAFKVAAQSRVEKNYTVTVPYSKWVQITNDLEIVKNQLRQSDLPSKQVAFMSDSLLSPLQTLIGSQVTQQLQAEQKKDTTISKPRK